MPAQRSLLVHPNLRHFKLEAKRRLRTGEFGTLHEAQLAVAREHDLPSWPALRRAIDTRRDAESRVLPQIRWLITRFRDASEPGWAAPGDNELQQHFCDEFVAALPAQQLAGAMTGHGVDLSQELVILEQSPLVARLRIDNMEVHASAEAAPPHRINGLFAVPVGGRITGTRITGSRVATPAAGGRHEVPAMVTGIVAEAVADLGLAGLVLAGQPGSGKPAWTVATGLAGIERSEPMTAGHRFPLHVATTLITAYAVLRLVAAGQVGLDHPASGYLRTVALADEAVTVRELLTHTGGVDSPAGHLGLDIPDLAGLRGPVLACGGSRGTFQFSIGGYVALGQLIADVTGSAYPDAVAELVFTPLGMTASSFPASVADIGTGAVTGYNVRTDGTFVPSAASIWSMPAVGGLWTTAADLARLGGGWSSLLPAELARESFRPHARIGAGEGSTGLGWFISTDGEYVRHGAMAAGTSATVHVRRADNQVLVTMTNRAISVKHVNWRVLDAIPRASPGLTA